MALICAVFCATATYHIREELKSTRESIVQSIRVIDNTREREINLRRSTGTQCANTAQRFYLQLSGVLG